MLTKALCYNTHLSTSLIVMGDIIIGKPFDKLVKMGDIKVSTKQWRDHRPNGMVGLAQITANDAYGSRKHMDSPWKVSLSKTNKIEYKTNNQIKAKWLHKHSLWSYQYSYSEITKIS